jgi:hypothetical protein
MASITVPLDASGIPDLDPKQAVKVLLTSRGKPVSSKSVTFDRQQQAKVAFNVDSSASGLRVIVGPHDATDEDLLGLQTIGVDVPLRRFLGKEQFLLPVIRIPPYYWYWWLRWCRSFTIRGRVLCADGSAVPGAVVCAYDVDAWWWWWSTQQIGCATTDATGSFSISFRWCCGWWPWWWWYTRHWYVEPAIAGQILRALQREPRVVKPPIPDPVPDLRIFDALLGAPQLAGRAAAGIRDGGLSRIANSSAMRAMAADAGRRSATAVDPARLDGLRERLAEVLPEVPALQSLHLWPWWPWQPWWDCNPDVIFRATQQCGGAEQIIVGETIFDTRWNIPTALDVTLTASSDACCVATNDCIEGECIALTTVCGVDEANVGGNSGAAATPVGYAFPNVVANWGDAPFAGEVDIHGTPQCLSGVDYYEIEFSADGGATWAAVPPPALGTISRIYHDFDLGADVTVTFSAQVPIGGHNVYETIEHYEAGHTPTDFSTLHKVWLSANFDVVIPWRTAGNFGDGTYTLRVIGWDEAAGVLSNRRVLPVCETTTQAQITVTLDNQALFSGPDPDPNNPCGGPIHFCTDEPQTDIVDARIVRPDGTKETVGPCGGVKIAAGDLFEVDFIAYDAQGHLASYSLRLTYGANQLGDILATSGVTLNPLVGGAFGAPAASQVGPGYAAARNMQGATAPVWTGGAITLSVPATAVFPESCCYQLRLDATNRTIVDCGSSSHSNASERSFQVTV